MKPWFDELKEEVRIDFREVSDEYLGHGIYLLKGYNGE